MYWLRDLFVNLECLIIVYILIIFYMKGSFFYKYLLNGWKYNVFCFYSVDVNYSRFYINLMIV